MIENSLPQASFFFFAIVKFGKVFKREWGNFFKISEEYTPLVRVWFSNLGGKKGYITLGSKQSEGSIL